MLRNCLPLLLMPRSLILLGAVSLVQPVLTSQFLGDTTVKDVAALVAPILHLNKPVLMQSVCLHALIWPRVLWAFQVALVRAGP